MVGILVICHRQMAKFMKDSACGIVGEQEFFEAIEVCPCDTQETVQSNIAKILENWKNAKDILVFVDIFGGTPCNSSAKYFQNYDGKIDIISGVSLPMILTALTQRKGVANFDDLRDKILEESKKNIISLKGLNLLK